MNDDQIEDLLRKAPGPTAPEGLAERLKQQIRLPQSPMQMGCVTFGESRRGLMRWLPAFSVAAFFLACIAAIGVQTSLISGLRHDNETLRATAANLDQLRAASLESQRLQAASDELGQLRKDHDDLLRLRNEVAQLRVDAQETEKLRADNQKLQSNNAALRARLTPGEDPLGAPLDATLQKEKDLAERAACANNLKQIGLAIKMWSNEHDHLLPTNYLSMSNLLVNPKILQCPDDKSSNINSWEDVANGMFSYPLIAPPGWKDLDATRTYSFLDPQLTVTAWCPIHHVYLLIDGSVQRPNLEDGKSYTKQENGRTVYIP